jgi:hypothetical protein
MSRRNSILSHSSHDDRCQRIPGFLFLCFLSSPFEGIPILVSIVLPAMRVLLYSRLLLLAAAVLCSGAWIAWSVQGQPLTATPAAAGSPFGHGPSLDDIGKAISAQFPRKATSTVVTPPNWSFNVNLELFQATHELQYPEQKLSRSYNFADLISELRNTRPYIFNPSDQPIAPGPKNLLPLIRDDVGRLARGRRDTPPGLAIAAAVLPGSSGQGGRRLLATTASCDLASTLDSYTITDWGRWDSFDSTYYYANPYDNTGTSTNADANYEKLLRHQTAISPMQTMYSYYQVTGT